MKQAQRLMVLLGLVAAWLLTAPAPAQALTYGWTWPSSAIVLSDQTGGGWSLATAVSNWNKGNIVQLRYTTAPCSNCIVVTSTAYIPCDSCAPGTFYGGLADWVLNGTTAISATILLSNQVGTRSRLPIATHEIGHTLGLATAPVGTKSIMLGFYDPNSRITKPQPYDFHDLRNLYG